MLERQCQSDGDFLIGLQTSSLPLRRGSLLHRRARRPLLRRQGGRMRSLERRSEEAKPPSTPPGQASWSHHGPGGTDIHVCSKVVWNCSNAVPVLSLQTFTPSGGFTSLAAHSCNHEGQCKVQLYKDIR